MYTHPTYRHCCVMDFTGGMKDLSSIITYNTVVSCKSCSTLSDECMRVLDSIPSDNIQEVKDTLNRELGNHAEVFAYVRICISVL